MQGFGVKNIERLITKVQSKSVPAQSHASGACSKQFGRALSQQTSDVEDAMQVVHVASLQLVTSPSRA